MIKKIALSTAAVAAFVAGTPVMAHHSANAQFDTKVDIKLVGVVTKVENINPHSWWHVTATGPGLRIIPIDARKRDEFDSEYQTYNGMGLARWDSDTLLIESVGFNDITWLGWKGYFHTNAMTVTERFRRQGDLLFYNFTVDDPDVLAEPWTSITYVRRANPNPVRQDEANICDERDAELLANPFERG